MQLVSKKCGNTYIVFFWRDDSPTISDLDPYEIHRSCVKTEIIWSCLKIAPFFRIKSILFGKQKKGFAQGRFNKNLQAAQIVPQSHHQRTDRWISATWIGVTVHGKHLGGKKRGTNGGTLRKNQQKTHLERTTSTGTKKIQKDSKTEEALLKCSPFHDIFSGWWLQVFFAGSFFGAWASQIGSPKYSKTTSWWYRRTLDSTRMLENPLVTKKKTAFVWKGAWNGWWDEHDPLLKRLNYKKLSRALLKSLSWLNSEIMNKNRCANLLAPVSCPPLQRLYNPNSTNSVWKSYLSRFLRLRFTPGFGFLSIFIVEVCTYTSSYLHPNDWTYILYLGWWFKPWPFWDTRSEEFCSFKNPSKTFQKQFSKQPFSDIFRKSWCSKLLDLQKLRSNKKKKTTKGVQNKWHKHVNLSYLKKHTTCQIASFHVLQAHILISCPSDIWYVYR